MPYWAWSSVDFGGTTGAGYIGPRTSYRTPSGGMEVQDICWGINVASSYGLLDSQEPDFWFGGFGSNLLEFPRQYFGGAGRTIDGQKVYSEPGSNWPVGFGWWQWTHACRDTNGNDRWIWASEGANTDESASGVWHCFYSTNYGKDYEDQWDSLCLTTRVSGWNSGLRPAGIWSISSTVTYLFFVRSGQVYFVKRDDNANTWSAVTQVTSGGNSITKLYLRAVGAGQSTKLYLITDDGGKVFVWDWSTESSVSSSFTIAAFPTHVPRDAPINIGSDYYHFHWVHETRTLYKWQYTTSTYANPTRTTLAVPANPGYSNEFFLGYSIEFNTSTSELYLVAHWRNRDGWYPTGSHFFRMRYMEGTAGSSWSSEYMINKRPVYSNGGDPSWENNLEYITGTNPDGEPYSIGRSGSPINVSVLSAYSHGSNNANRPTVVYSILETPYYSNPEEGQLLRGCAQAYGFWEDGGAFYVDAGTVVNVQPVLTLDAVIGSDGFVTIAPTITVTPNESYVSSYSFTSKYDIAGNESYQNAAAVINPLAVLTLNGSLASEQYVAGEVLISAGAVLTIEGTDEVTVEVTMDLHIPYFVLGTAYHEELLGYINAKRAEYGLPPYLIPNPVMYQKWTDVAQLHADNMASTRTFAHEGANLPSAWDTYAERYSVSGAEGVAENIQAGFPENSLNYPIWDDQTIPSPWEAYDAWWNSPTHRENILRDWGSESIYSWLGISLGQAPPAWGYDDYIFYLCNNFARYGPEATVMAQKDGAFHVSYDLTGAMVEHLNVSYDLETYTPVSADHSAVWSLRVSQQHSNNYGARVSAAHEAPIFYGLTASHEANYSSTELVRSSHTAEYRLSAYNPIVKAHEAGYSIRVAAAWVAPYDSKPVVVAFHKADYSEPLKVSAENIALYSVPATVKTSHVAMYGVPANVRASNTAIWSLQLTARAAHEAPYLLLTSLVADHEAEFDIRSTESVRASHRGFYSLLDESLVLESSPSTVTVGSGTTFSIPELVLETSEDSSVWSATFKVYQREEFLSLNEGDEITLTLGGDSYTMLVMTKSLSRQSPANVDMRITAASRLVLLDSPRASKTSYSFDAPMMAKDMVEAILGETVTWNLVNWQIPASRVQFQDVVPLEAAKRIIQAAGGVIQSNADGSILVRSEFPIATNIYADATPDHVYTDDSDNISMSEGYEFKEQYNQFRISELDQSQGDQFEWIPSENSVLIGVLRFYPSPWRENVTIRTTEDTPTTVYNQTGIVLRTEIAENVEFRNGTASVEYPILGTPTIEWLSEPLGAVVTTDYNTSLTAPKYVNGGYGLAKVTYQVRAIEFAVQGVDGTSVQFIAEEV